LRQFLLCLFDGRGHTKAETTAIVNLYLDHFFSFTLSLFRYSGIPL
jgi:hypothetical protein